MKFLNYAKHMNASEAILQWVDKRMNDQIDTTKGEHIIDYLVNENPKVTTANYEQVKGNAEKWLKQQVKKGEHIKETADDTKTVLDFKDGFKVVQLIGKNAYDREGYLMRHCVASYFGKDVKIYSLRDKDNVPHCTMEQDRQVKGKGNGDIHPKYVGYVVKFLEHIGMKVGQSEMLHLGYIFAKPFMDELGDETKKQLFNDEYLPKNSKLIDKDGSEFATLEILDQVPLVSEEIDGRLKINFDLPSFIKLCVDFIFKKNKKVKDKLIQAASGDSAQLAASGDSAQLAASGDYAKLAASGYSAKLAASGYSAKLAASGDSAQLAASGDSAKLAASGYSAKLAASGDSAQLALEGNDSVGAAIGIKNIIKGKIGCWITLAEYDDNYKPICMKSAIIDGKKLKADTWYKLVGKKFVEVK